MRLTTSSTSTAACSSARWNSARALRQGGVPARQGGDECPLLPPVSTPARGRLVASQIEDAMRRHVFWLDNHPLSVTVSIGVALYPRHGTTVEQLLSNADLAMY